MKVGDYVRTDTGEIGKVISIAEDNDFGLGEEYSGFVAFNTEPYVYGDVIKSSPNIIDLIEVGDVLSFKDGCVCIILEISDNDYYLIKDYGDEYYERKEVVEGEIKSIVTREQFESLEYRIGE